MLNGTVEGFITVVLASIFLIALYRPLARGLLSRTTHHFGTPRFRTVNLITPYDYDGLLQVLIFDQNRQI